MENNDIFKYFNPKENTQISSMNVAETNEFIQYLNKYYLKLRDNINIEDYITFGLELELENTDEELIISEMKKMDLLDDWPIKKDTSLKNGTEITSPILIDSTDNWLNLVQICNILKKHGIVGPNCAGHVHIGSQIIDSKPEILIKFIQLWQVYEDIIYRFLYGEYLTARPNILKYARPMAKFMWNDFDYYKQMDKDLFETLIKDIYFYRNGAINFTNFSLKDNKSKNTIEFRNPNGTLNPVIWQNNLNLLIKMFLYAQNSFDLAENDELRYLQNTYPDQILINEYNKIYFEKALKFCDLIFDNNLDKLYFLRQYLKSFETSNMAFAKAKTFTK